MWALRAQRRDEITMAGGRTGRQEEERAQA